MAVSIATRRGRYLNPGPLQYKPVPSARLCLSGLTMFVLPAKQAAPYTASAVLTVTPAKSSHLLRRDAVQTGTS